MQPANLSRLTHRWEQLTHTVLRLKRLPVGKVTDLLNDTREALAPLGKQSSVPKEALRLFLEIKDFVYFALLMEEKELESGRGGYEELLAAVKELEENFLAGDPS